MFADADASGCDLTYGEPAIRVRFQKYTQKERGVRDRTPLMVFIRRRIGYALRTSRTKPSMRSRSASACSESAFEDASNSVDAAEACCEASLTP